MSVLLVLGQVMKSDLWGWEEVHSGTSSFRYKVKRTLFSGKSDFQSVDVVETEGHGMMLLNDGLIMVSDKDEFIYHDMLTHVPLFTHPNPKNVLVIGGGDGGTACEAMRHPSVEKCTMVEIDKMVVDACKEFIPSCSKDFDNPKMNLIIGDGVKFVKETTEKFDVIMVDSTDPIGPATPLFGIEFYQDVFNCLNDNGIVVSQGESPWYEVTMQNKLLQMKNELFDVVTCYNFHNLTYPGGYWSFTWGSKGLHPLKDFDEKRVDESNLKFRYYTKDVHRAAFALPQFQLDNMEKFRKGF